MSRTDSPVAASADRGPRTLRGETQPRSSAVTPRSSVDPFDAAFLRDPYPVFEALRDAGPVVYLDRYDVWAIPRHAECTTVLGDPQTFCSGRGVGLSDFAKEPPWRPQSIIIEADPPLHTRTHRALLKVFTPAAVRRFAASFERTAREIVGHAVAQGEIDGLTEIARAFPLAAFPDAVGIQPDGREHLLPYGEMVFNAFGPRNARFEAAMTRYEAVTVWINDCCRRENLAPGGIGQELHALADAGDISHDEATLLVRSLLAGGLDPAISLIGNALVAFARFPEQWSAVRADPSLLRAAIDEVCRFESPVTQFFRTTTRAVEIGGVTVPEGSKVLAMLACANRDPRRWDQPDSFDVRRRAGHLGFGHGIHHCVGELLAKLEVEAVLAALAERVATLTFTGEPRVRLSNTLRGYERIPLRLIAA